jgi:hypothetical protein
MILQVWRETFEQSLHTYLGQAANETEFIFSLGIMPTPVQKGEIGQNWLPARPEGATETVREQTG